MAIPTVKIIPAIPGKVKVASNIVKIPIKRNKFITKVTLVISPKILYFTNINNITRYRGKMKKKYDFDSIIWEKCLTKEEDDGNTSNSKNEGKNSNDTNYIYQIKLRDYECYLKIKLNDSNLESNIVGPCDIQTPFCQDVLITGNPVVGNVLKAQAIYWGGVEGASEYSWIRLVKGKREKFSTKPIEK